VDDVSEDELEELDVPEELAKVKFSSLDEDEDDEDEDDEEDDDDDESAVFSSISKLG
jgi:hypothetical protein